MKIEKCALTIINARLSDKGMYVLMARNEHGSITTQSFVDVQGKLVNFLKLLSSSKSMVISESSDTL